MSRLQKLIAKSKGSKFYKWVLNFALARTIPFNSPHKFKVVNSEPGEITVVLPFKRGNMNHVHSLHACALATLCEFTTGLALVSLLSETEYRILLKNIRMDYLYQGKTDVKAEAVLSSHFIQKEVIEKLAVSDAVYHEFEIKVFDTNNRHICTGFINWQIKKWEKAKLK